MVFINDIIKREVNPFDLINLKPGDFWEEQQDSTQMVESIHQKVITEIEEYLDLVAKDNRSRSLLLLGDSGSGKSYLLGRVKRTLNPKAFFAYIGPWADSDYIWRHILRSTVDSLLRIPEGQQESQLILWLKNLSAFTRDKSKDKFGNYYAAIAENLSNTSRKTTNKQVSITRRFFLVYCTILPTQNYMI